MLPGMKPVVVITFHCRAAANAGPLTRMLAEARRELAETQRKAWLKAGAADAVIVEGEPDGLSFGERLAAEVGRRLAATAEAATERGSAADDDAGTPEVARGDEAGTTDGPAKAGVGGVIVLGSGSIPMARSREMRQLVFAAAGDAGHALANNRYSADVVAVSRAADLASLPPLPADNALPRWLEEKAGVAVTDLRKNWRLGVDVDTPLDLLLLGGEAGEEVARTAPLVGERLGALYEVLPNRRAELLIAGRVSTATLRWLERAAACRVRALVEERGLRAATVLAQSGATTGSRPPRSVLGELLDRDGPESLAHHVAQMADAAVIDTRVLMAHRCGADERRWPDPEDRYASDLLLPQTIADPWLRALTQSAIDSSAPIVLGGHTMVNGGLRLLARRSKPGEAEAEPERPEGAAEGATEEEPRRAEAEA